ncbi:hypothetical protein AGMMS49965_20770 [Bacteroidia bacterium]|nr:hypothetical protein AGMMS49965_20770 [Bacteroidia bacterium]
MGDLNAYTKTIICYHLLSVLIFCLSKLKDLFEKEEKPEYITRQELFVWLDEYFSKKSPEKSSPISTRSATNENSDAEETPTEIAAPVPEVPTVPKNYAFPPLEILTDYPQETPENIAEEIETKKQVIKQTLGDFGISVSDISATVGATITLYELVPARGVAIDKITNKNTEIAIALKVEAVRIIAPFKNRGTVAIEVPNENRSIAGIKLLLESIDFQNCTCELLLAIGKSIDGNTKIIDLTEMPHILVAGASGKEKSVGLNAMILSLLYKKSPKELQFILFDPKRQELDIYKTL